MEYNYQAPESNLISGKYNDYAVIGNIIDLSSLGFTDKEYEELKSAGYHNVSDILNNSDAELQSRISNEKIFTEIQRIKTDLRLPLIGKRLFSNKILNILFIGNITNLEQLMNTSFRYLYSIPNFGWSDLFEIIQRLDILFCLN